MKKITGGFGASIRGIVKDLWIVLLDVIAVNAAYYLALLIRFYVNQEFRPTVTHYLDAFYHFAPFYTVICVAVFALFRLYGGVWRYAGVNDMNRILGASAVTALIHVLGTALFVERMPITYYGIGAVLQFMFIAAIRFGYRVVIVERRKIARGRAPTEPALVVGAGEMGRRVVKQLEDDGAYRAVCVVDSAESRDGKTIDGIPVVGGTEHVAELARRYGARSVFVADPRLSAEGRAAVRAACRESGLEMHDYTGSLSNLVGRVPLAGLLESVTGPVSLTLEGKRKDFATGDEALQQVTGRYTVREVRAEAGRVVVDLQELRNEPYIGYEAWAQQYRDETGQDVSFF